LNFNAENDDDDDDLDDDENVFLFVPFKRELRCQFLKL